MLKNPGTAVSLTKQQPSGTDAQVQRVNQETRAQLRELLHAMPPKRFEALIMELLLQMGFDESTVTVTPYGGDGGIGDSGIDVTGIYRAAGLTEVNAAVHVKRWQGNARLIVALLYSSLPIVKYRAESRQVVRLKNAVLDYWNVKLNCAFLSPSRLGGCNGISATASFG